MEYIFGSKGDTEILKTIGHEHVDAEGVVTVIREYSDSIITDKFKVVNKFKSSTGRDGTCYDWFEITDHTRMIDKSPQLRSEIQNVQAEVFDTQDALCESFETQAEINAMHEEALCELYEMIVTNE